MDTSVISVRVDSQEKNRFEALSRSFGLSLQDLIRMFISDSNRRGRLSFELANPAGRHVSRGGIEYFPFQSEGDALDWTEAMAKDVWEDGK